jgi:hypothetical protein
MKVSTVFVCRQQSNRKEMPLKEIATTVTVVVIAGVVFGTSRDVTDCTGSRSVSKPVSFESRKVVKFPCRSYSSCANLLVVLLPNTRVIYDRAREAQQATLLVLSGS